MEIKTLLDVQNLIENKIEESLTLEYKSELGKKNKEIAKDISSFANTKGGTIVYGLNDKDGIPLSIAWIKGKGIKERIENISNTAIQPGLTEILTHRIPNPENESEAVYVVTIPESFEGPHMADYRYYKRHNYKIAPMDDQEVKDTFVKKGLRDSLHSEIHRNWRRAVDLSSWLERYNRSVAGRPISINPGRENTNNERTIIPQFSSDVWKMIVSSGQSISFGELSHKLIHAYDKIEEINQLSKIDDLDRLVKYPDSGETEDIATPLSKIIEQKIRTLQSKLDEIRKEIDK